MTVTWRLRNQSGLPLLSTVGTSAEWKAIPDKDQVEFSTAFTVIPAFAEGKDYSIAVDYCLNREELERQKKRLSMGTMYYVTPGNKLLKAVIDYEWQMVTFSLDDGEPVVLVPLRN